jgi:hypothetical protein
LSLLCFDAFSSREPVSTSLENAIAIERVSNPARPRTGRAGFCFAFFGLASRPSKEVPEKQISKRTGLGIASACLMGSIMIQPASAADKVSLFKVVTAKSESPTTS